MHNNNYKPKHRQRERNSLGNSLSLAPLLCLLPLWWIYPSHCFPLLKWAPLYISYNHPINGFETRTLIDIDIENKKTILGKHKRHANLIRARLQEYELKHYFCTFKLEFSKHTSYSKKLKLPKSPYLGICSNSDTKTWHNDMALPFIKA